MDLQRQKSAQVDITSPFSLLHVYWRFVLKGNDHHFKCTDGRLKNHECRGVAAYRRKFLSNVEYRGGNSSPK